MSESHGLDNKMAILGAAQRSNVEIVNIKVVGKENKPGVFTSH